MVQTLELEERIKGIGPSIAKKLVQWGFYTVESLAITTVRPHGGWSRRATAMKIIEQAKDAVALTFI